MKIALRGTIVLASGWAILAPAMYGLLFAAVLHWSAFIDILVVISCIVLAVTAFRQVSQILWIVSFTFVGGVGIAGFFHHFRDSGESGPLPFEWINSYFLHAVPILAVATLTRIYITTINAQQGAAGNVAPRRAWPLT
jgi:hypothetical protein